MESTRAPIELWRVTADVEVDQNDFELAHIYVFATSRRDAETRVEVYFWDQHPHDLCRKGHAHVGVDKVRRNRAVRVSVEGLDHGIVAMMSVQSEMESFT